VNTVQHDIYYMVRETILIIAALFPIVNPLGSAAIFLNLVGNVEHRLQEVLSQKIAIYSFSILIVSLLWGVKVLSFFGISIYAVQIGGGLIVCATGWSLLGQSSGGMSSGIGSDEDILDHAFYPYTLPITVGPGSISVAITLGAHLVAHSQNMVFFSPQVIIPAVVGSAVVCLIVYICYRYAKSAERLLGKTGTDVLLRLSSFILFCIGIQIVANGVTSYLPTIGH
jgi:multiple antibiotic resistance protein